MNILLKLLVLLLVWPGVACAQFGSGPFGNGSSSGSSSSQWTTTGSDIYYTTGNVGIGTTKMSYPLHVVGNVRATSFVTDPTSTPQTDYYPTLAGDTHYTVGVSGDGGADNDDNWVVSEGTTLGSSNRISVAPGGIVTIPTLTSTTLTATTATVTTINSSTVTASSDTLVNRNTTETLKNKKIVPIDVNVTQSATPTINTNNGSHFHIVGLAQAITSLTTNLSGSPNPGETIWIDITDSGTARTIAFGTGFEASGTLALPTTTVISTRLDMGFVYNEVTGKWRIVAAS